MTRDVNCFDIVPDIDDKCKNCNIQVPFGVAAIPIPADADEVELTCNVLAVDEDGCYGHTFTLTFTPRELQIMSDLAAEHMEQLEEDWPDFYLGSLTAHYAIFPVPRDTTDISVYVCLPDLEEADVWLSPSRVREAMDLAEDALEETIPASVTSAEEFCDAIDDWAVKLMQKFAGMTKI